MRLNAIAVGVGMMAINAPAPALAADGGIRAQCWSAEQLRGRVDEIAPRHRAPGSNVPIPRQSLVSHQMVAPGAVRRVELPRGSKKLIALTFDLCETPGEIAGYDGPIIEYLRANGIKATFFAGGKWLLTHDNEDQRSRQLIADPLFEMGNHAWAHRNLRLLSGADLRQEIEGAQRAYELVRARLAGQQCVAGSAQLSRIPDRISLMRFPFGACNPQSLAAVAEAGLTPIQWDISTGDPSRGTSARQIVAAMLRARPGSIIINHANGLGFHTSEALPIAIPKLKAMGFEFVTVSELLAAGKPVIEQQCYDNRPGDTDRYDTFFLPKKPKPQASDGWTATPVPR